MSSLGVKAIRIEEITVGKALEKNGLIRYWILENNELTLEV